MTNQEDDLSDLRVAQEDHMENISLSPLDQQQKVWNTLLDRNSSTNSTGPWPAYDDVISHLSEADYTDTLTCPYDTLSPCPVKTLCPQGLVCCVDLEIFTGSPYSGLLTAESKSHCILRLSSAMKPPGQGVTSSIGRTLLYATGNKLRNAKLFPCAALKAFRCNEKSGNLLLGGSKLGQRESDFFEHCVCTSMTEQMPKLVKPLVRKFWQYSDYPLSLGVSDFCKSSEHNNFPFAIIWKPCVKTAGNTNKSEAEVSQDGGDDSDHFGLFMDRREGMDVGTVLYDVFACPDPACVTESSKLQRIGRITTTSKMIRSSSVDGLFFRHQKKEEDYALRPNWPASLKSKVTMNNGKTTGTIGMLAGWKLFEQQIEEGKYIDFEKS